MTPTLNAFAPPMRSNPARVAARTRGLEAPTRVVRVAVELCEVGNYLGPARKLLDALRWEFPDANLELGLSSSSGGVFEVFVEGRLVFSKKATRRLPDHDEIFYHVSTAIRGA